MSPIELILSRLENPKQGYSGQWTAKCPAHNDRTPSLSIREGTNGGVLMHCHAGCETYKIIRAAGLDMSDLYPPRYKSGKEPKRLSKQYTPAQALKLLSDSAYLIIILGCDVVNGKTISQDDLDSCLKAVCQIVAIRHEHMGNQY